MLKRLAVPIFLVLVVLVNSVTLGQDVGSPLNLSDFAVEIGAAYDYSASIDQPPCTAVSHDLTVLGTATNDDSQGRDAIGLIIRDGNGVAIFSGYSYFQTIGRFSRQQWQAPPVGMMTARPMTYFFYDIGSLASSEPEEIEQDRLLAQVTLDPVDSIPACSNIPLATEIPPCPVLNSFAQGQGVIGDSELNLLRYPRLGDNVTMYLALPREQFEVRAGPVCIEGQAMWVIQVPGVPPSTCLLEACEQYSEYLTYRQGWVFDSDLSNEEAAPLIAVYIDYEGRDFNLSFNTETCAVENGADFIIYEILRFYGELGRITNPRVYTEHFATYFGVDEGRVEQLRQYVERKLSDVRPACINQLHYLIGTRPVDMSSLGNISYGFFVSLVTLRSVAGSPLATLVEHVVADLDQRFNRETRIEIQESCNYVVSCVLWNWFLQGDFPGDRIEIQVGRALAEGFLLYGIPIDSSTLISLGNEFELSF